MAGAPFQISPSLGQASMYGPASGSSGGGGGGGGVTGAAPSGSAGGGTLPNPPQMGLARATDIPVPVDGAFTGLNLAVDPARLSPLETPWAVNFDGITRVGNVSVRRGLAKLQSHLTLGAGDTAVGFVPLNFEMASGGTAGAACVVLVKENTGTPAYSAVAQQSIVARVERPLLPPTVAVDAGTEDQITVSVSAMTPSSQVFRIYTVWSTTRWPDTPWVDADRGIAAANRTETDWDGSGQEDVVLSALGLADNTRVYITVWVATRLGFSPPRRLTCLYQSST